ncbi:MAG: SDR family oxidoreductase, partial [Pseudonocardiaceae bacterium]
EQSLTRILAEQEQQRTGNTPAPTEITAEAQRTLASREARATLEQLEQAGSPVRYLPVDVRDAVALTAALGEVRREWGPITGIVHAAGVVADKRITDKTDEQFQRVFDTKVAGLRALLEATADDPLDVICLFSSVVACFGNPGQCDYAMANEVLDQVASVEQARRPGCLVRSIAWGPWRGGMITPSLANVFSRIGIPLIPLETGADAFAAELAGSAIDARVVVATSESIRVLSGTASVTGESNGESLVEVQVSSRSHPYLADHEVAGVPVLPMAVVLDWFVGATRAWRPDLDAVVLRDLRVLDKVVLPHLSNGGHRLAVHGRPLEPEDSRVLEVELRGAGDTPHYRARWTDDAHTATSNADWDVPAVLPPLDRAELYDGRILFHGPCFQALQSVRGISAEGAEGTVVGLRELGWLGDDWHIDPAAVDGGLQLAVLWAERVLGNASLPMAIQECRIHKTGALPAAVRCVVRARQVQYSDARCDVALIDTDGSSRVELLGVDLVLRPDRASASRA